MSEMYKENIIIKRIPQKTVEMVYEFFLATILLPPLMVMQIVFLVLGGWGVAITTAMKVFGGKNKEETGSETAKEA